MRAPETPWHRAAPRPAPRVRSGIGRLVRGTRRRARAVAVLTAVSVVGGTAFIRLTTAGAATPPTVPATDFAYLKEGAASCLALTPAKLAGQIAGSRRASKDSAIVASVGPGSWDAWAPWPGASPADHRAKILALAHQTCDFVGQLRVLAVTGDPWQTAVAATHVGVGAVKAARGVPAAVTAVVQTVQDTADWYGQQKQFGGPGPAATTAPGPTATAPTTTAAPSTSVPAPAGPSTSPPSTGGPTTQPAMPASTLTVDASAVVATTYDPNVAYQITNSFAGRVLELPGDDNNTRTGIPVQLWTNLKAADQYWRIAPVGDSGYVAIVNGSSGKALSVRDGSVEDFAGVDQVTVAPDRLGQQWQLRDAGDGQVWIVNRLSGKALDLLGEDLPTQDGQQVDLWSLQTYAKDQRWTITR